MNIRKVLLRVVGALSAVLFGLVILVFLLLVLGIRIDLASFRNRMETAATEAAGRRVTIQEPLFVKLSFFPLVESGGIRVAGPDGSGEDLLRLGPSQLQISLASLLRKELLVTRLSSKSVGVSLPGKAQETGIASAAESAEKRSEGSGGFRFGGVKSFSFPSIEVRYRGPGEDDLTQLSFQDLEGSALRGKPVTAGIRFSLRRQPVRLSLSMPPFDKVLASGSPWPLEVRGKAPGVEASAAIPVGSADGGWPPVKISLGGEEFGDLEWLAGRALPKSGPFTLECLLTVKEPGATISGIRAEMAGIILDGDLNLDLAGKRPRLIGTLEAGPLDFETIMNLAPGRETTREEGEPPSPPAIPGVEGFDFGVDLDLSLIVGEVLNAPVKAGNISLGFEAVEGSLRLPFSGFVEVFEVDGEVLAGGGRPRPHLTLSMAAREVDLDLFTAAGPAGEGEEQDEPSSTEGAAPLPAPYLSLLDADFSLEVGSLKGTPIDAKKIFIGGTLRDGKLNLPFKAILDGVTARGSLQAKAAGERLEAVIGASARDVDLAVLSQRIPELETLQGKIGKAGLSLSLAGSGLDSIKKSLSGQVDLAGADLTWRGGKGEEPVNFTVGRGRLRLPAAGRIGGELEGSLLGESLAVEFKLRGDRLFSLEGPMKLEAEAEGGGGKASLKGTLSGQQKNRKLALDFTLGGQRLGDLAAWTGLSPDAGGPYALDGGLVLDGNRWQFSIRSMALGRSRLSGKVGMGPGETRALLTASLHAKLLDLAELKEILPEESSQSPEESSDVSQGGLADIPDVDLDLSIDRLPSAMGDITDLQAVLSMREGQVREAPFRAVFDGALYQGDLQMTLDDGRVAAGFFLSAEGVDGGSLLEKSGAATDTEAHIGKARLELHVAGKSPEDLVDSLRLTAWIEDSDLTLPDPHTDETIHLGVNRLMLEIASAGKVKMQLDGNLGEHPVSAEGDLLISQGTDMAPGNTSASVQVTGFGGSFHLDGSLPFPFSPVGTEMVFSLTGESLERFNPLMDVSLPPFGPIKVQGRLSIDQEGLHFTDTVIKVGETEIRSLVRTIRRGEKPRMEVEFRSDRLQLNDFSLKGWSPVEIKEETASPSEEPEKIEMAPALHPEVLRRAEGKLTIEAAEVYSGEHKIGSASLEGNLENDRLDLTLDLKTFTGDVILDAGFDASAETTSTDFFLAVENFDYGRLTEAMKSENPNKGRIAGIMELTSRGDDFSRIMENATGRIDFTVWPIGVRSRIFNFWAENVFLAILPAIGTERAARVNCVVGLFDLKDGLMKPKNLIIDTSTVRVRGSGQVDMKTGSLELTLRPTAKSPQFFTLAAPVSVTGTMSDPKVALAPLSLAGIYIRHALSIFTVPLRWVFEKKMPADGSDVCHPPPDERVKK